MPYLRYTYIDEFLNAEPSYFTDRLSNRKGWQTRFTPEIKQNIEEAYSEDLREFLEKHEVNEWAWIRAETVKRAYHNEELIKLLVEKEVPWAAWRYAKEVADVYSPKLITILAEKGAGELVWDIGEYYSALDEASLKEVKGAFKKLEKKADRYDGGSLGSIIRHMWQNAVQYSGGG